MACSTEDHIAIERLMYEYARCADRKDYDGFSRVFLEDAVFDYRGETVTSFSAIRQMMHNLEHYSTTLHQVQNVLYDVDGDTAAGETYCLASHLHQENGVVVKIDMGIVYRDELRRTAGGWRIARRAFDPLWTQTAPVDST